jgi:hypothetical protein
VFQTYDERDMDYELAQQRPAGRRLIRRILDTIQYPNAKLIVWLSTFGPWLKWKFSSDSVYLKKKLDGQPVVMMILWEKGKVRSDVERLLRAARAKGAYILVVNTAKLAPTVIESDLFDTYIERFNYGRDFGSYKSGILHLQNTYGLENVSRLIVLNDSVYYLDKELDQFLDTMINAEREVLGATENFEVHRHIGSFAFSVGNQVLKSKHFLKYWKRYRLTDLRVKVIKKGEMKLTKVLLKSVFSENEFEILYSVKNVSEYLNQNNQNIEKALSLAVQSRNHWRKLTVRQVMEAWRSRNLFTAVPQNKSEFLNPLSFDDILATPLTFAEAVKELKRLYPQLDSKVLQKQLYELVIGALLLTSVSGSQIHQNGLLFHEFGCPLVKLDVIYRGAWSYEDAEKLLKKLLPADRDQLSRLLYSRAYGEDALRGWRRAAFMRGLI